MDDETREQFAEMWAAGVPLAEIATTLGYSFTKLAKWRMMLGLRKRYGADDDGEIPAPDVIKLRAKAQQTNWTPTERRLRWRGTPHTIYETQTGYDGEP